MWRAIWRAIFHWFVKLTGILPFWIACRPKVYYEDKKAQSRRIKGKAIIAPLHTSVWDVATMMMVFFWRNPRCVVAELMFEKNPFLSFFLKSLGSVKVDRNANDFRFLDSCKKILDKNGVVEIYPESRLPRKGEASPLPFKPSTVYLALQSGAPIIPVATNGKLFSKKRTRVMIGKPIDAAALYDKALSEKENVNNITKYLRDKIIELQYELERKSEKKA